MIVELRRVPKPRYNGSKARVELRMPCGRLLFTAGKSKRSRRLLSAFNVPMHLGRCWKCQVLTIPGAVAGAKFKFILDTQSKITFGILLGFAKPPIPSFSALPGVKQT